MQIAAYRNTLPQRRAAVNTETTRRCDARRDVICDVRLSAGARLVYVLLDDYSWGNEPCWPSQDTLAARLGMSPRHVKRHLAELEEHDKIKRIRGRNVVRYLLAWQVPSVSLVEVPKLAPEVPPVSFASKEEVFSCETEPEPEPDCPRCRDTGHTGDPYTGPLCDCPTGRAIRARLFRR